MGMRSIESMTRAPQERAEDTSAAARQLLDELRPYSRSLALALVLVAIVALSQAIGPWLIGRAIDRDILGGDPAGLVRTMAMLFVVYVVDTVNQLISQGFTQLLGSLFSLIGIVVAMLILDWRLALVCFAIIPVMLLTNVLFARRARRAFRATRETVGDVTAGLQEEIVGIREAQAFNRIEANIERFRERNAQNRAANVQAVAITSAFAPTIDVLSTLSTAVGVGVGGGPGVARGGG